MAEHAGRSISTVSAALNGSDGVAEKTREEILRIAAELGYQADPRAQFLRRSHTGLIGASFAIGQAYQGLIVDGLFQAASTLGHALVLATSTPQADPGGDYAWQVFDRIDALYPGAGGKLKARARQLVGGRTPGITIPPGIPAAAFLIAHDYADISLGYAHYAAQLANIAGLRVVSLPETIAVTARYTAASLSVPADALLAWLTTPPAQAIIQRHGFLPPDGQE